MQRVWISLVGAALLFVAQPIAAETNVEAELAEMRELVEGLQKKVDAQDEQLSHQSELLEQAQSAAREAESDSRSSLSDFVDSIDVDGHIAGSWNWNFNHPDHGSDNDDSPVDTGAGGGLNQGDSGAFYPFHGDHNTFTVDQIWFGLGKPATEESRAGFRFDIFYGNNANFLGQGIPSEDSRRSNFDSTSDYYIAQAYIEYLAPVADANLKFGKFQTPVGAEVVQATGNFNITRGNVYSLLQPVDHMGLLGTVPVGPVELMAGIVSSVGSGISSPDFNDEKSYLGSVAYATDRMSIRTTFVYGAEGAYKNENNDDVGLVDVTAWFDPADNVSLWANYNYLYLENSGLYAQGVAIAGRVGITDDLGFSLRGEYVREHTTDTGVFGDVGGSDDFTGIGDDEDSNEIWSVTGTVDYALTDHLTVRAEGRWDLVKEPGTNGFDEFPLNGTDIERKYQIVGLVEAVYEF